VATTVKTDAPDNGAALDALADFRVSTKRAAQFKVADSAKRAPVPAHADGALVMRAARSSDGAPYLLCTAPGVKDTAIPLSAVGAAIAHGVITRDEIKLLLGES
jgi:hypothetical protein